MSYDAMIGIQMLLCICLFKWVFTPTKLLAKNTLKT